MKEDAKAHSGFAKAAHKACWSGILTRLQHASTRPIEANDWGSPSGQSPAETFDGRHDNLDWSRINEHCVS